MSENEIAAKLDTLIRLQAHLAVAGLASQKEKIIFLGRAGLSAREISEVLGTTTNTVSVALSNARKEGTLKRSISKQTPQEGGSDDEK